ncbi:acyl-CoA synthetase FdrA [Psychrobacter frigidicola]|uniref:Acyl-CoA synthetase FdrA n=1 Tax=Psychrobacter frigidicola TaxID=45611 RepID=A0A5C7A4J6_9GAMM|nr:acyl-CoA synthetase FdrA [Psychrobacter frigidicola]TXD98477.1 acyl-CoA synthetase FdrA [Psychrobacter frigidicola]
MPVQTKILSGVYADSMTLMALSTKVNKLPGVQKAMIGMGTAMNKAVISDVGLMTPEVEAASTSDMIYAVECETEEMCAEVLAKIDELRTASVADQSQEKSYRSLNKAIEDNDSSLVVISVPGEYAANETRKALEQDKNVMIFSDNVTVEDELALKQFAHEKGLLVMGPDCGTAIINNVGLCFANAVSDGSVGVVAASGTGAQELSVQVDALGGGISQLIGVGGRDLSEEIGGIMMIDGLNMLAQDDQTKVIVLVSKPPAESVANNVLEVAKGIDKPVVVCFIGDGSTESDSTENSANLHFTNNTLEAAKKAVQAAGLSVDTDTKSYDFDYEKINASFAKSQKFIRGIFCGGTICDEVFYVLKHATDNVVSNVAKNAKDQLEIGATSHDHALLDMGSDEFTSGRPHPMIDPTARNARLVKEAQDPETAVLLLDFVLGYGSNDDPVGAAADSIKQAYTDAKKDKRSLQIIAYVLGTDRDPQGKKGQIDQLKDLGVHVVDSVVDMGNVALKMMPK